MSDRITYKSPEEVELIRESSLLVSKTLGMLGEHIRPGVSTLELDILAETFIRDHQGVPAFKDYKPSFNETAFPFTLCVSTNEEVVHGMPSKGKILLDGDIVSIDCGVLLNGFYGDSAYTFAVGEINAKKKKLLEVTKAALMFGISKAVEGNHLGEISYAVQKHAELNGFSVVREMVGHGVGRELHEPPEVPNYGRRSSGMRLKSGMVLAIEPMINMGKRHITVAKDGWTVFASDRSPSAHFEHTVVVQKGQPEILTSFSLIETAFTRG